MSTLTQNFLTPPHSKESEMMVIGCMLTDLNNFSIGADVLDDSDFFFIEHKIIFQSIKQLFKEQRPVDVHLICEELKDRDQLSIVGGAGFIAELAQYAGTSAYIEEYISAVRSKSLLRKVLFFYAEQMRKLEKDQLDIQEVIEESYQGLIALVNGYLPNDKASLKQVLSGQKSHIDTKPLIIKLKERQEYYKENKKPFITGIQTGFIDLDRQVTLLEDTNLVIIAARPAMGKTALALNIAANICFSQNLPIAFISLEMGVDQLAERLLSIKTGISGESLKRGTFSEIDYQKLQEENSNLSKGKFFIHENCTKISQLTSSVRRLKDEENIRVVFIDYLQLMTTEGRTDSRQYEVAEVSRRLKLLAMELRIPIVVVAQLSRKVEERADKHPLMSDLRDSGQVEQDADAVLFIYREEYYFPQQSKDEAEIFLGKNRHGPTPSIKLSFSSHCGRFSNYTQKSRDLFS